MCCKRHLLVMDLPNPIYVIEWSHWFSDFPSVRGITCLSVHFFLTVFKVWQSFIIMTRFNYSLNKNGSGGKYSVQKICTERAKTIRGDEASCLEQKNCNFLCSVLQLLVEKHWRPGLCLFHFSCTLYKVGSTPV